jgi:hypothetical protein
MEVGYFGLYRFRLELLNVVTRGFYSCSRTFYLYIYFEYFYSVIDYFNQIQHIDYYLVINSIQTFIL